MLSTKKLMRDTDDTPIRPYARFAALAWLFGAVLVLALVIAFALGTSLGTFFAGLAVVSILVPFAAVSDRRPLQQWLACACVTDAIAITWLVIVLRESDLTLLQWLKAYCLVVGLAWMLWAIAAAAQWLGARATSAASITVVIGLGWLTAPVWLLHHLQTPELLPWMGKLIAVHPLFAMNTIWPLGVWTESPIAYRIMNLNQDVFYQLPSSPWPSVLMHTSVGIVGLICVKARHRPNRAN